MGAYKSFSLARVRRFPGQLLDNRAVATAHAEAPIQLQLMANSSEVKDRQTQNVQLLKMIPTTAKRWIADSTVNCIMVQEEPSS